MDDIIAKILALMPEVKAPQRKYLRTLFATLSSFVGKANFRHLARHCDLCEHTFSRWFRRAFEFVVFNQLLIRLMVGEGEKIGAIDASFLSKSGKCTAGLGTFWNGALGKPTKGLEISTVAIVDVESNTAYHLASKFTDASVEAESRTKQYIGQVQEMKEHLQMLQVRYIATDAYYSKKEFTDEICSMGFHQIGKLRHDASLKWRYEGEYSGRGRPRKYDGVADTKTEDLSGWHSVGALEDGTCVYEAVVWVSAIGAFAKVVLLRRHSGDRISQALLFSTDTNLPAYTIVQYYKLRFQIEFVFRDGKQHTGLGDCQSTNAEAQNHAANASLTTLNLLKIENRIARDTSGKIVISIESMKRRKANQQLMDLVFDRLGIDRSEKKVVKLFAELSDYGCIAA